MGLSARGFHQILPETGPRPLVVRGAPVQGSSYEDPLGRRENRIEFNKRQSRRDREGLRGKSMCWDRVKQANR